MLKRARVGTRTLTKTFNAAGVQDGSREASVLLSALTKGQIKRGTVLRVIFRRGDGTLVGQRIPPAG